ncbi:MAG: response regulator [Candidatus Omnitrophica bacterium]|nr:response regulator [Candidatus Omnitrophota bacterium]
MEVLIIDSAKMIRSRINEMLSELTYISYIQEADNIQQALNFILDENWDLIILDIRLPDGSGLDVLKYIKYSDDESVTVIMLIQEDFPQYRERTLALGANYYLRKTDDISKIMDICHDIHRKKIKPELFEH